MNTRIAEGLILAVIVVLLGWEAYALGNRTSGDTISEIVWQATRRWPIIAFLAGVLCGHFFWQR